MNTFTFISALLGAIAGKLLAALFFIKVLYPIFLKKHEKLLVEIFLGLRAE